MYFFGALFRMVLSKLNSVNKLCFQILFSNSGVFKKKNSTMKGDTGRP